MTPAPARETLEIDLDGYTDLPPGRIANVVTYLERRGPPAPQGAPSAHLSVRAIPAPNPAWYQPIYRRIGEPWLWFSRLVMPDAELATRLAEPTVEVLALVEDGIDIGLAELDLSLPREPEIAMFGVVPEATGTGAARFFMDRILERLWRPQTERIWLHTCTFDHPAAVPFYRRAGFEPYKFAIEVSPDPRLTGHMPREAAPHIPLIEKK